MATTMQSRQRVLVVGSSCGTGAKLVHAFSEQMASKRPIIYAFCKSSSTMDQQIKERCNRVIEGDYQNELDIERAIRKSCADTVIFVHPDMINGGDSCQAIGNSSSQAALDAVLRRPAYQHVTLFTLPDMHTATEPSIRRLTRKTRKLKGVSGCMLQLRSVLSLFARSISIDYLLNFSERSSCAKSGIRKWQKRKINSLESKDTWASTHFDTTAIPTDWNQVPTGASVHIKVAEQSLMDFVVGAVMDCGTISSLKGSNHPRDITVTPE